VLPELDYDLKQALAATPTGQSGLEVLCAKRKANEAAKIHQVKAREQLMLEESRIEAEEARGAAKASHVESEAEVTRLKKRKRELSSDARTAEEEELNEEAAGGPPPAEAQRRSQRQRTV